MSEIYISWSEYHNLIEKLAILIYRSNWKFDQILCLARGGLRIGDILSRVYKCPLAILSISSYDQDHNQGVIKFAKNLTMTTDSLGAKILLVDDLVDTGKSLTETIKWINTFYPEVQEIRTGVLWSKGSSNFIPNYHVETVSDQISWIYQPFERYENWNIESL